MLPSEEVKSLLFHDFLIPDTAKLNLLQLQKNKIDCNCLRAAFTRSKEKVKLFAVDSHLDFILNSFQDEGQQSLLESGL